MCSLKNRSTFDLSIMGGCVRGDGTFPSHLWFPSVVDIQERIPATRGLHSDLRQWLGLRSTYRADAAGKRPSPALVAPR